MKINKLVRRITCIDQKGALGSYYIPLDPFRIYERLVFLFTERHETITVEPRIISNIKIAPPLDFYRIFVFDRMFIYNTVKFDPTIRFMKWVLQEIPPIFWKYNIYIDINKDELIRSAEISNPHEIWVGKRTRESSIHLEEKAILTFSSPSRSCLKGVTLTESVRDQLMEGSLFLPTYDQIVKEVEGWGSRKRWKYKKGIVKEVTLSGKKK